MPQELSILTNSAIGNTTVSASQAMLASAQVLLTGLGFQDLQPGIYAAEQAEQNNNQALVQALELYLLEPNQPAYQQQLSLLLTQAIQDLKKDIARFSLQQERYQAEAHQEAAQLLAPVISDKLKVGS